MARLFKTSDSGAQLLSDKIEVADSFFTRIKGLLGRDGLGENEVMWIKPCNNIHTFFMKFSIDCIFVDKKMEIKKLAEDVGPFQLVGPYWNAYSVIETKAGFINSNNLKIGDQLYVVS